VTELFGSEQARLSAEDWLDELALMDSMFGLTIRDWQLVTVAAPERLASRLTIALRHGTPLVASTDN
jgi:hypothetical protein